MCQRRMTPWPPQPALDERVTSKDPAVGLAAVLALRDLADEVELAQVTNARRAGWSWETIGAALGVTRQSIHKKYARSIP